MIYTLFALVLGLLIWALWMKNELEWYRMSTKTLAQDVVALRKLREFSFISELVDSHITSDVMGRMLQLFVPSGGISVVTIRECMLSEHLFPKQNPLTPPAHKAQDSRKRLSGSQLRRMAENVNAADTASFQERPNSEILQEQE